MNYIFQFVGQLAKNLIFIEEFSLISVLKVFCDSLSHLSWQFPVGHIFFNLLDLWTKHLGRCCNIWRSKIQNWDHLFSVLSSRWVQALNQICGMAEEHCITCGPTDHWQHSQPHVRHALRWKTTITNAQHVWHGFEHGPRVLFEPICFLECHFNFQYVLKVHIWVTKRANSFKLFKSKSWSIHYG